MIRCVARCACCNCPRIATATTGRAEDAATHRKDLNAIVVRLRAKAGHSDSQPLLRVGTLDLQGYR